MTGSACVHLFWLPLGAGGFPVVRWSGHLYEAVAARRGGRAVTDLYHSALRVRLRGVVHTIEMAPVWSGPAGDRGVVAEGPVGRSWLGRSWLFRYEVRRWRDGSIPDIAAATMSPQTLTVDAEHASRLLEVLPVVPRLTWGRDEWGIGDMWTSNSLISWALAMTAHPVGRAVLPPHGRAPGWAAGLFAARRRLTQLDDHPRHGEFAGPLSWRTCRRGRRRRGSGRSAVSPP